MPKITKKRILFTPEDRNTFQEVSKDLTPSDLSSIFGTAIQNGDTTKWFKLLLEIAEKDPDVLHALETRTSMVLSKEWIIESENKQDAEKIAEYLKDIKGDPTEGLLSFQQLLSTFLNSAYLTGLSLSEVVSDGEKIIGFNHIPSNWLTFYETVYYPKLYSRENTEGTPFIKDKMLSHYLTSGKDPVRGWLGLAIAWLYVFKRMSVEDRLQYQSKYGKPFLLVNMDGDKDNYVEAWATAEELIENINDVDGVVFPGDVEVQYVESSNLNGEYFFQNDDNLKRSIVKVILGQESTASSEDSNRSTADVHMSVLEKRVIEDMQLIENTLNTQLLPKLKEILSISENTKTEFKFVMGELEATMDEDLDTEEVEEDTIEGNNNGQTEEVTEDE